MDIADWRKKIDEIDQQLVEILNRRAQAAQEIGRLKRQAEMPIYEPDRERIVLAQVQEAKSRAIAASSSDPDLRAHHGRDAQCSEGRDRGAGQLETEVSSKFQVPNVES